VLARAASAHPDKTALACNEQRFSYAALEPDALRLAARLLTPGIAPLDRVVVQLPNPPERVPVYFALARIGAIPVMALRARRHTEVCHFLAASGAKAYVIPDRIGSFDYLMAQAQSAAEEQLLAAIEPDPPKWRPCCSRAAPRRCRS
jgi:2,3-dihydroxybenzoate-AMP ligase